MDENNFEWHKKLIQECIKGNKTENLNIKDSDNKTAFFIACDQYPELALEMLNENKIDFNIQDNYGDTGFLIACMDCIELASKMLKKDNINFNIQNTDGETGFIWACLRNTRLAFEMLKKNDIDFNIQDKGGNTAFIFSCGLESPDLVIAMLENNKVNTKIKNNKGETGWDVAKKESPECFQAYKSYIEKQQLGQNIQTIKRKIGTNKPIL